MAFNVPNLEEIHRLAIADYSARFPTHDVSRYSDNWKRLRVIAGMVSGLHAHIDSTYEDLLPDGASDEKLDRFGTIYNVARKQPTAAHKEDALRLVGTSGSAFSQGDELAHADGTRFQVDEDGTIPSAGYIDVDVLALDTGSITRKNAGEVLVFVSPPSGIQSKAELQLDIDVDGDDLEAPGVYRQRILDKIAFPGMGGNEHDYLTWAIELTGIANAYVFPLRQGLGTVDIAALHGGTGSARALDSGQRDDLFDHIDAIRPVAIKDFRVLETTAEPTDVDVLILPEDGAQLAFDWNDSTPPTVSAWDATLRKLTFDARPADLRQGDRLTYKSTSGSFHDGSELTVESLSSTDAVIVVKSPTVAPVTGNVIYSGGPLVQPIRLLILALIDSMGPGRGLYAAGNWEGTLRTSTLFKIAQTYPGVLDSYVQLPGVNTPGTNIAPDATVGYITPRQIIVRRWWQ